MKRFCRDSSVVVSERKEADTGRAGWILSGKVAGVLEVRKEWVKCINHLKKDMRQ